MFPPSLQAVATERASGLNWGVYSYIAIGTPPLDERQSSYGFLFSRMVGDHYEVKVDGAWTPVPYDKINSVVAPRFGGVVLRSLLLYPCDSAWSKFRVAIRTREIYHSANGDRWLLARDPNTGRVFVRHEPNLPSGGQVADIEIGAFLIAAGSGPEKQELLRLIGTLV
jgi:hypothetical protein